MIDLTGQHIFIAGGSRGIGAAAARMAASAGAAVTVNYAQSKDRAEALVREIAAIGGKAFAVRADVAEDGALDRAMEEAVRASGAADGAGGLSGRLRGGVPAGHDRGVLGPDHGRQRPWHVSRRPRRRPASAAGGPGRQHRHLHVHGGPARQRRVLRLRHVQGRADFVYAFYGEGVSPRTKSASTASPPPGPRPRWPPPAWTPWAARTSPKTFPLGRIGLPEDVAGATCFLLSGLAQFITGTTLTVDGGMDMRG